MNTNNFKRGFFVTGTDTGVGKTVVSAWLVQRLSAAYWKPIQSGLEEESDSNVVGRLTSGLIIPEACRLRAPLSPHEAARRDGVVLNLVDFVLPESEHPLVVEGAGGVMVPLNDQGVLMVDLMAGLGLPVILTARTALGSINHTLLSLEVLRNRRVPVAGVILSGPPNLVNREAIVRFGAVRVLAEIPWLAPLSATTLAAVPGEGSMEDWQTSRWDFAL